MQTKRVVRKNNLLNLQDIVIIATLLRSPFYKEFDKERIINFLSNKFNKKIENLKIEVRPKAIYDYSDLKEAITNMDVASQTDIFLCSFNASKRAYKLKIEVFDDSIVDYVLTETFIEAIKETENNNINKILDEFKEHWITYGMQSFTKTKKPYFVFLQPFFNTCGDENPYTTEEGKQFLLTKFSKLYKCQFNEVNWMPESTGSVECIYDITLDSENCYINITADDLSYYCDDEGNPVII